MSNDELIKGKACLLIIDMQRDFIDSDAAYYCERAQGMIPKIKDLIDRIRKAKIPIIYTQEVHRPDLVDMGLEMGEGDETHCIVGTKGVEIISELAPANKDIIVKKPRLSAFIDTDMQIVLRGLGLGYKDTLIIVGVVTNICILFTAADAIQQDYNIRVVEECVAAYTKENHEAGVTCLKHLQKNAVVPFDNIINAIENYK